MALSRGLGPRTPHDRMTPLQALRFVAKHGVVLEAARGAVPSLLEAALGHRPRGSWWGHPRGKQFFWLTRAVRQSPDAFSVRRPWKWFKRSTCPRARIGSPSPRSAVVCRAQCGLWAPSSAGSMP